MSKAVEKIDWDLLAKQKKWLAEQVLPGHSADACEEAEGLLALLDAIQDEHEDTLAELDYAYEDVYVDVPDHLNLGQCGSWKNVRMCSTKREAVAWIRENIGPCDDEGNVCLITTGAPKENSDGPEQPDASTEAAPR